MSSLLLGSGGSIDGGMQSDFDAGFVSRYRTLKIDRDGVKLDVDKAAIAGVPYTVQRRGPTASLHAGWEWGR